LRGHDGRGAASGLPILHRFYIHDQKEFWEEEGKAQKRDIKELEEQIRSYETAILSRAFGDSRRRESPNALQDRPCINARSMLQGLQGQRRSLAKSIIPAMPDCPISDTIVLPVPKHYFAKLLEVADTRTDSVKTRDNHQWGLPEGIVTRTDPADSDDSRRIVGEYKYTSPSAILYIYVTNWSYPPNLPYPLPDSSRARLE